MPNPSVPDPAQHRPNGGRPGDARTALRAAEVAGRLGEPAPDDDVGALAAHARTIGTLQRLLAVARASVVAGGAREGPRHVMAEMAIDLATVRELVWRADPGAPFSVALAGVAVRDAAVSALSAAAAIVDEAHRPEFEALRAALEADFRVDPTGSGDLEVVAGDLLSGAVALGGRA